MPTGAYIYDCLEVHNGNVYATFYRNSQVLCARTGDYREWSPAAMLPGSSLSGFSRFLADEGRLYLFAYSISAATADAYVSEDEGENWEPVGLPEPRPFLFLPHGDVLICVADSTVSRSTDRGATWETVLAAPGKVWDLEYLGAQTVMMTTAEQVIRSADLGASWEILPAPYNTGGVNFPELGIYPTSLGVFVEERNSEGTSTLYRSTDQGESWDLFLSPADSDSSNVQDLQVVGNEIWSIFSGNIAVSADGGESWQYRLSPDGALHLAAKGDTIFAGGSNGFFKTYDQAQSWISGNLGWQDMGLQTSIFLIGEHISSYRGRLYFSTWDGLYATGDDGLEWALLHDDGYFSHLASSGDTVVLLGSGALRSFDGGASWAYQERQGAYHPLSGGDYQFARVGHYLFSAAWHDSNLYRSADWGSNWDTLPVSLGFIDFIAGAGNTLYVVNWDGALVSTDYGQSFSSGSLGQLSSADGLWSAGANVFALENGQLYRLANNQWLPASVGLFDEMGYIPEILSIFGTTGEAILYGYGHDSAAPHIHTSTDGGRTWSENQAESLPELTSFFYEVARLGGSLYAVGETQNAFEPHIWKRELPVGHTGLSVEKPSIRLFPNPASEIAWLEWGETGSTPEGIVSISTLTGQIVWEAWTQGQKRFSLPVHQLEKGAFRVVFTGKNGALGEKWLIIQR